MEQVTVNAAALRQVLIALNGPSYLIRELQFTRDRPLALASNPIDKLIDEFNTQVSKEPSQIETLNSIKLPDDYEWKYEECSVRGMDWFFYYQGTRVRTASQHEQKLLDTFKQLYESK